jgi:hypothetical protein
VAWPPREFECECDPSGRAWSESLERPSGRSGMSRSCRAGPQLATQAIHHCLVWSSQRKWIMLGPTRWACASAQAQPVKDLVSAQPIGPSYGHTGSW